MSGTKLNITVEELADFIMAGRNDSFDISEEQARQAARRMLAADALYKAAFLIARDYCGFCGCDLHNTPGCGGCINLQRLTTAMALAHGKAEQ